MTVVTPSTCEGVKEVNIQAVIFDLDGTLLDTESLSCRAVIDSFELSNLHMPQNIRKELSSQGDLLPWELKRRILGLRGSEWIPIVLGYAQENWGVDMANLDWREGWQSRCNNDDESRKQIVDTFWKSWELRLNQLCEEIEECPGATDLVNRLTELKIPCAIATSSRMVSVKKKRCRHEDMFKCFRHIITGDNPNIKRGKPAPDIFLEAAKQLGFHPSECLAFEDSVLGAQSAKSAGCHVVAVPDGRMEKQAFASVADEVLSSMKEFSGKRWGLNVNMSDVQCGE
ncbi:hypothetical protein ACHAXN_003009 [Cyclotella atomus]